MVKQYDLGIIGGGPAGYTAALRAAAKGLSVVMFERNKIVGVCLNSGCIPTKAILHSAEVYNEIKCAESLGIFVENSHVDFAKVIERKEYRNPDTIKPKPVHTGPEIVDFNNLQTTNRAQATSKEEEAVGLEEFLSMGEVMQKVSQKVNVNTAAAGELTVFNGINIAIAKKIVEYRNLNGNFKSIDEFIEVAGVDEHFIPQIKSLAVLEDKKNGPDDAPNEGRLIDW